MLTEFGRFVRKLRIDEQMTLGVMASGIGCSIAYLSAVENGKKKLTDELVNKVYDFFGLDDCLESQLRDAATRSRDELTFKIAEMQGSVREATVMFARSIESSSLSDEQLDQILKILNNKG